MNNPVFFGIFDITSLVLTAFVLFFFSLVIYLRREDRREGYPLEDDVTGRLEAPSGFFFTAAPKTFHLGDRVVTVPNNVRDARTPVGTRTSRTPGSPLEPTGDPMMAAIGPGAYAERSRAPDLLQHGGPRIAPLRAAPGYAVARLDADPRGMTVLGADRLAAGVVNDVWIDKAEFLVRYLEVGLPDSRTVLLPMTMADIDGKKRLVKVDAVLASQFAGAPALASPDQVTMDEEERVCAYYGGGYLYATPARTEPLL